MKALLSAALLAAATLTGGPAMAAGPATPLSSQLTGTVLTVTDPQREVAFYRDVLGLSLAMTLDHGTRREYMLRFSSEPTQAGIILLHDSAPDAPRKLELGNAFSRLVLRVSDMDALVARLDAMKLAHDVPRDAGHGYRVLMLTDPEGYRLEVIQAAQQEHKP